MHFGHIPSGIFFAKKLFVILLNAQQHPITVHRTRYKSKLSSSSKWQRLAAACTSQLSKRLPMVNKCQSPLYRVPMCLCVRACVPACYSLCLHSTFNRVALIVIIFSNFTADGCFSTTSLPFEKHSKRKVIARNENSFEDFTCGCDILTWQPTRHRSMRVCVSARESARLYVRQRAPLLLPRNRFYIRSPGINVINTQKMLRSKFTLALQKFMPTMNFLRRNFLPHTRAPTRTHPMQSIRSIFRLFYPGIFGLGMSQATAPPPPPSSSIADTLLQTAHTHTHLCVVIRRAHNRKLGSIAVSSSFRHSLFKIENASRTHIM